MGRETESDGYRAFELEIAQGSSALRLRQSGVPFRKYVQRQIRNTAEELEPSFNSGKRPRRKVYRSLTVAKLDAECDPNLD